MSEFRKTRSNQANSNRCEKTIKTRAEIKQQQEYYKDSMTIRADSLKT